MSHVELQQGLERARAFLHASRAADGGWGYARDKQSYAEPTCYTLLALHQQPSPDYEQRALDWLTQHTNQVGALTRTIQSQGNVGDKVDLDTLDNWGTLIAFFTLQKLGIGTDLHDRYLKYLLNSRGNLLDKKASAELKLNGELQAWSWARGTASWVEPTAYALLGLKANGMKAHERVQIGEQFLFDRACYDGGWNYGNKEVLKVVIEPMPTNTCFALLALQDADRHHETIKKSVAYLEQEIAARQSTLLLALGTLCLSIYERPTETMLTGLLKRQQGNGSWRDNIHLTALAALALQTAVEKKNVFQL